jgi:hypothetical protein
MKSPLSLAFVIIAFVLAGCAASDSGSSGGSAQSAQAHAAPRASAAQRRALFLRTVDEAISGPMIAAGKYKYVGRHVDLHCTVASIVGPHAFNASCGQDADGFSVNIVIVCQDARSLSEGQPVRVIGVVAEPLEGGNLMGGAATFPTVDALYLE